MFILLPKQLLKKWDIFSDSLCMCPLVSATPVFKTALYISRCRHEGPALAIFILNGPRAADACYCAYHPGLLRAREGAVGYTYGTLEHLKAPVKIFHEN